MTNPEQGNAAHPRAVAEQVEADSQDAIQEVQRNIAAWEQKLQNAADANLSKEDRFTIATEAISEIEKDWPYNGYKFFISGKWTVPSITLNIEQDDDESFKSIEGFSVEDSKENIFDTQWNKGIGVREIDGRPRLGFVFTADSQSIDVPFLSADFTPMAFAVPEEISLTLMDVPSQEQTEAHAERIIENLELYDRLIEMFVSRDEFLRQTRSQQERLIRKLVLEANEQITAPGIMVYLQCETSDIYARTEVSTSYGFQHLNSAEREDGQMLELQGIVRGVGFLEQSILAEKALKQDSDFIDRSAGLCLVMEVANDYGTHLLYVPYQSIIIEEDGLNVFQSDF